MFEVLWPYVEDGNTLHPRHQGNGRVYGVIECYHWIISEVLAIASGHWDGYPYLRCFKLAMWRLAIK